jgi:zinc protease
MQGQAQDLGGNWMAAGDLNFSERYLAAVKRVTPAELQRVAREYLTAENRTLYALLPKGTAPQRIEVQETILDHPIQKMVLPGGLRLLVKEDHRLPFVEIRTVFKGGVLAESSALNGITLLLARMLLKGTTTRSAEQIARAIESVGGSIDSYSGNNSFGVNVEVLSADFKIGLDLVSDVLLHPALSASDFDFERQMQLANIKALKDQVLYSGSRAMRRAMFGETSYGLDINGSETSVPGIQVGDLQSFHRRLVTPNNCVLAIYGDVRLEEVQAAVETVMGGWPAGETVLTHLPGSPRLDGVRRVVEIRDKKQAVMLIGYPGVSLYNPDRFALELVQEACSDLGSRVFLRIREKLGLAYYVGAQNFVGLAPGFFAFYAGTSPETVDLVESELLQEGELLRTEGLAAEELKRAKAKLIGQKKISRQDLGAYAITTALDELYELGYTNIDTEDAKYEAVTLEQIKTVARKYLDPEHLVITAVKPA